MDAKNLYSVIPLSRAVNSAIIDSYEEKGRVEERYSHWAVRVLRKLNRQVIKANAKRTTVSVSRSTMTASLPVDFKECIFIGFIDRSGRKVPIDIDADIYGDYEKAPETCCEKCGQPKELCEALKVTVETKPINPPDSCDCYYYTSGGYPCGPIGGGLSEVVWEENVTKTLLPNGDYIEDRLFPIFDPQTCTARMTSSRKLIQQFDINDCGCIKPTKENADKLCSCNSDLYHLYFNNFYSSDSYCEVGVKIFLEQGVMQFSGIVDFDKVFMEYYGDLPKKNGSFMIPEVALEAIVAGIHVRRLEHKKGTTESQIARAKSVFKKEKTEMSQLLWGRLSINDILTAATQVPII